MVTHIHAYQDGWTGNKKSIFVGTSSFFSLSRKFSSYPIAHPHSHSGARRLDRGSNENPMAAEHCRNDRLPIYRRQTVFMGHAAALGGHAGDNIALSGFLRPGKG